MDLAVASAKDEYPDFFNAYKTSRKLVDSNSVNLALRAAARELTNGEPVNDEVFIFRNEAGNTDNGELVKKTSKKGNFQVKSIETGTYKVAVSKKGYRNKEVSVTVADGERSQLTVEMEKV